MAAKDKNAPKDVRSAVQLEQELQIAFAQKCVAVLDVYSSEWGNCRAISETFTRLKTEYGDDLRFFTVECNQILENLKAPGSDEKRPQRPKNIEALRDTLPEVWQPILEARRGKSEPYFLFYKEGKKVNAVQGVNTPLIRAVVKDLCTVKTPASEIITNPKLLEVWEEYFNPEESEVAADKFLKALTAACKLTVQLTEDEKNVLFDAIGAPKADGKQRIVHAEGLQKWFGDDENRTLQQAFTETLPDYEERAVQVRLEREAEEKRRQEEEEKRKADEEKRALEKKAEEAEAGAASSQSASSKSPEVEARELDEEIANLENELGAEVVEDPSWKAAGLNEVLTGSSNAISSPQGAGRAFNGKAIVESNEAAQAAAQLVVKLLEGTNSFLAAFSSSPVNLAAAQGRESLHQLTSGIDKVGTSKLAAAALSFSTSDFLAVFGQTDVRPFTTPDSAAVSFRVSEENDGEVRRISPLFLASVTGLASEPQGDLFLWDTDGLQADQTVTLDPMTPLSPAPREDGSGVKIVGLKEVLDHRPYSRYHDDFVYTTWFVSGKVVANESSGALEIHIEAIVCEDDFVNQRSSYSSSVRRDDERLRQILSLHQKRERRAQLPAAQAESAEAKPASRGSDKGEAPQEEKPASRGSDKGEAAPAEKPASRGSDKGEAPQEEKPASRGSDKGEAAPAEKPASRGSDKGEAPQEEKPASRGSDKGEAAPAEKPASRGSGKGEAPAEEAPSAPQEDAQKPPSREGPTAVESSEPQAEQSAKPSSRPSSGAQNAEAQPAQEPPADPAPAAEQPSAQQTEGEAKKDDQPAWMD